ncbi:MAG: sugar phosphate isomerase/epimerase [Chloroflexi bacterium]|nr:sugar phosphate isomerase/epimerase [Chloroflexota bacterium]
MNLGMLTSELSRPTASELFRAVAGYGFTEVQLDLASVAAEQMPERLDRDLVRRIRSEADAHGVAIVAINGTFNMSHPDRAVREEGIRRLTPIAGACEALGCRFVTLCTGSRSRESMWRWDDGNLDPSAWADMLDTMASAVEIAERYDLLLGIEPEASNVVNTAARARRLLDEMGSPRLKIIMDVANLFQPGEARPENVRSTMDRAFALLGEDIHIAHGKDIRAGEGLAFTHAGEGIVDYGYFLECLEALGYRGGMILHGIKNERYMPSCVSYMRAVMASRQRV